MSCDQTLDKLSEKLNSRLLVQEEHCFQEGAQCATLATEAPKKPGLDRVKVVYPYMCVHARTCVCFRVYVGMRITAEKSSQRQQQTYGLCHFYLSYFSSFLPFCLSFYLSTNDSFPTHVLHK